MNLKLDLGFGFRFWLDLHLPYVTVWLSRFKRLSRLAKCPGISLQRHFQINSSLVMHCYEIIPSWKAWLCFKPWLGGAALFDSGMAALFDSPRGGTSPCRGPGHGCRREHLSRECHLLFRQGYCW